MPVYTPNSPSLQKYNMGFMDARKSNMSGGNIIGDPFALATISLSVVSGNCEPLTINTNEISSHGSSPSSHQSSQT
jgi:hypothetical protein